MVSSAFKAILIKTSLMCLSVAGIVGLQLQQLEEQISENRNSTIYERKEQSERVALQVQQQIPTFGFDNLLADWNFLNFIQYFGDDPARQATGYDLIPQYFDVVTQQDPRFVRAYFALSTANSVFAGQPEVTVNLVERGLNYITPETSDSAFLLWTYKAVDEILFLDDLEAARQSYLNAAAWLERRATQNAETVAERFRKSAQFLATNPDPRDTQIGAWFSVLKQTSDPKTQRRAITEIERLGGQVVITESGQFVLQRSDQDQD